MVTKSNKERETALQQKKTFETFDTHVGFVLFPPKKETGQEGNKRNRGESFVVRGVGHNAASFRWIQGLDVRKNTTRTLSSPSSLGGLEVEQKQEM
mmetsp:Transcript_39973/g.103178  ORF Transcript_39973/g.103178 Transcript_39973/m.103178 type:complete len:96 (+) Transcript_39973:4339-4626(+)